MWIWEKAGWPDFTYDLSRHQGALDRLVGSSNEIFGRIEALPSESQSDALIDLVVSEAIRTSFIEGQDLDRVSVRASVRHLAGLSSVKPLTKDHRVNGISSLLLDVIKRWDQPLSDEILCAWQSEIVSKLSLSLITSGDYRFDDVVIGSTVVGNDRIFFQAPPPDRVEHEMTGFLRWYNEDLNRTNAQSSEERLGLCIIRAGIAHLWFETIHPFDDGNGRVGRAIADHALSQAFGHPIISGLSTAITQNKVSRKRYYDELEKAQTGNLNIDNWLSYFITVVSEAQAYSKQVLDFVIAKTRYYESYRGQLNERQNKVIARMFDEGVSRFEGGISAKKYMSIGGCSKATATRDLQTLVSIKAIKPLPGVGRNTSYELSLPSKDQFIKIL
jgi:Fic family protein